jgi:hypothetical protein
MQTSPHTHAGRMLTKLMVCELMESLKGNR